MRSELSLAEQAAEVFAEWYERLLSGEAESADALCRAHRELEPHLRVKIEALALLDEALRPETREPPPPALIGPYAIEAELGRGGMGVVYRAHSSEAVADLAPGTPVALKVLHPHLLSRPGFFKRFLREAEIGKRVAHPGVVRTLDADALAVDGVHHHFLVMEYVEGRTLRQLQEELGRVPEKLCRHIGREVCAALAAIHEAGAVHRDLKPENVLVTPEHVVKVMDLGVARLSEEAARLSQTGVFVGSVHYAAPEQFRGSTDAVDGRADLHALGVVLYELATGVHPYAGDDVHAVIGRILETAPRRPGDVHPQLSPFFEELVLRLLAKDPAHRFDSAEELGAVLEEGEESAWWRGRAQEVVTATGRPLRRIRIPRETSVHGRERELARLRDLFAAAKSGEGRVVLLSGEAGIGKTRLVDELVARLVAEGEDVGFLFGSYPPSGAATASGAFSTAYREHLGGATEEAVARVLPETPLLVPAFAALLRGDAAPEGSERLTKDSLQTCFVHATRQLAREHVTIVLIDDLHFAPEEGRALFASLAHAVPGHRVLLVGTLRPGVSQEWIAGLTRLEHVTCLELTRLGPKDLIRLLQESFRSEHLAEELGARIALKSDGNPYFVFEIVQALRDGQLLAQRPDGTWASTRRIEEIRVPSSVLDLVNARVADLDAEERNLLDVAACCGFEFDPELVGAALGRDVIATLQALGAIEKRHRLVRSAGRRFVFDHHQVQEALYGALHETLRAHYHAAIAQALELRTGAAEKEPQELDGALCVDLCEHHLKGEQGERALRYLERAQTHLSEGYMHAQTVALGERALAVPDLLLGPERADALLRLARSLEVLGSSSAQRTAVDEAVVLANATEDVALRARAHWLLGHFLERAFEHEKATRELETARDLALRAGDRKLAARAMNCAGMVLHNCARYAEAAVTFEALTELWRELGDRRCEATAMGNLGLVFSSQSRYREAQEHHASSLALCREIGDRDGEARAVGSLGIVFLSQGRVAEAQGQFERSLMLSRAIGNRRGEACAIGNLGLVLFSQGRFRQAQECSERVLALSRETGDPLGEATSEWNLGNSLAALGRFREAHEHHERQLTLCRQIGYRAGEASARLFLGVVLDEEGDREGSEEHLSAGLALSREIGLVRLEPPARLALAWLRVAAGDVHGGREQLTAARDLARESGFPGDEVLARCQLALLPGGNAADALAAVTEHAERLQAGERCVARLLLWRVTGDRAHLAEAKRLLDGFLAENPPECHEAMCRNVRVNREILEAWRQEFGDDDPPAATESVTRSG